MGPNRAKREGGLGGFSEGDPREDGGAEAHHHPGEDLCS